MERNIASLTKIVKFHADPYPILVGMLIAYNQQTFADRTLFSIRNWSVCHLKRPPEWRPYTSFGIAPASRDVTNKEVNTFIIRVVFVSFGWRIILDETICFFSIQCFRVIISGLLFPFCDQKYKMGRGREWSWKTQALSTQVEPCLTAQCHWHRGWVKCVGAELNVDHCGPKGKRSSYINISPPFPCIANGVLVWVQYSI